MEPLPDAARDWIPRQRWFASGAQQPRLSATAGWDLPSPDPDVRVRLLVVTDAASPAPVQYLVPLVARPAPADPAHVIGAAGDDVLVDGPHDPAFQAALAELVSGAETPPGLRAHAVAPRRLAASARVLTAEQSNTSLVFGDAVIVKLFRRIAPGVHPDVELQSALTAARSRTVADVVAWAEGSWTGADGEPVTATLLLAQEFVTGADDGWASALGAARAGASYAAEARELGAAVAETHAALAAAFPTERATRSRRAAIVASGEERLAQAVAAAPALAASAPAIREVYRRAALTADARLQRVHGDLHLGQAIRAPGRGWVLLDFEGEPLRPLAERRLPDHALRDVAGMVRSFMYVAATAAQDGGPSGEAWTRDAVTAFLAGYRTAGGVGADPASPVLRALLLDKAVYEVSYEAAHRPSWIGIPLGAIEGLLG